MNVSSVEEAKQQSLHSAENYQDRERWTRAQLEAYQKRVLQACRQYAYAHSPFYQRFHHGLMERPLQELPILTKALLMEHFDELATDRSIRLHDVQQYLSLGDTSQLFLDRYRVMATSGSSGQPGIFLYDRAEMAMIAHSFARTQDWGGVTPTSRAAVVASTVPGQLTAQFPITSQGQPVPRIQLSASDPPAVLVQQLNAWQPDILLGFPSILATLAHEQRQGRLRIAPRSIFCGGETLGGDMRRRMEEAWQNNLFNVYGTVESGALAAECSYHRGLHLFEDFSLVEAVDQENRPVPPGTLGAKVLLTVLFRHTQPLIRYEITDMVRPSMLERCPCGRAFALLEAIEGRTTEMLYLTSPSGEEEEIHPFLFEIVLDELPVSGYQVVQELDGLHIFLTGAGEELLNEQVSEVLRVELNKRGVLVPPMEIHRVAELGKNATGKTPKVLSHVPRRAS